MAVDQQRKVNARHGGLRSLEALEITASEEDSVRIKSDTLIHTLAVDEKAARSVCTIVVIPVDPWTSAVY
eukprot:6198563-Pleurochrysis_carterae.AAC.1